MTARLCRALALATAALALVPASSLAAGPFGPLNDLAALGRKPTADELSMATQMLGSPTKTEGMEDLLWAMLNTREFLFNH